MKDNYDMPGSSSGFRRYISSIDKFNQYFINRQCVKVKAPTHSMFEILSGEQFHKEHKEYHLSYYMLDSYTMNML